MFSLVFGTFLRLHVLPCFICLYIWVLCVLCICVSCSVDEHMFVSACFITVRTVISAWVVRVVEQQQWLSHVFRTPHPTCVGENRLPAAVVDNFTPFRVCHSSRWCLCASGSSWQLGGPRPFTDSFCAPLTQSCFCLCLCQVYSCWPLEKVLDANDFTELDSSVCPLSVYSYTSIQGTTERQSQSGLFPAMWLPPPHHRQIKDNYDSKWSSESSQNK